MKHVMIDIETMGNKSFASIVSIAAVVFDLETGDVGEKFNVKVSLDSCLKAGLKIDASTVEWWLRQSDEARGKIASDGSYTIGEALKMFRAFITRENPFFLWGNSSRFDLGILENAYNSIGMDIPWVCWNERDVRTLVSFAPEVKRRFEFKGVKHDPLDDCLHQIGYCCAIYQKIIANKK